MKEAEIHAYDREAVGRRATRRGRGALICRGVGPDTWRKRTEATKCPGA